VLLFDSDTGGVNLTAMRNSKKPIINLIGLLIGLLIIEDGISDKGGRVKIVKRKKLAEVIMLSLIYTSAPKAKKRPMAQRRNFKPTKFFIFI
jgi:hypothetical protein